MIFGSALALFVGAVLAQQFKVLILAPSSAAALVVGSAAALAGGYEFSHALLASICAICFLQIGYLLGVFVKHSLVAHREAQLKGARSTISSPRAVQPRMPIGRHAAQSRH
jgi:hypothetical protein